MAANETSWKKGQSANPGGRPKEYFATKEYARKKAKWAFDRLEEIAKQSENLGAAYQATMGLLAYGIGKPVERIDATVTHNDTSTLTDAELIDIARGCSDGAAQETSSAADTAELH